MSPINALAVPEFVSKPARLAKLDEQDVEACLMLPTAGVGVEPQLRETPEVLYPSVRAFNRWLEEDWGYGAERRIYGAPILSLFDLQEAITELNRLLAVDAKFVVITAGPVAGRSPADPYFDPFWARCEDARINVVYHIGRTPFSEMYNTPWGLRPHPPSHRHSLMEFALSFTERPIVDTVTALIADNLFGRFPRLKVLSVEYGSTWVKPLLHKLDHIARLYSKDMWRFGVPPLTPSDTFRQNVWVAPFFEDDIVGLAQLIGAAHVLNGSDYPHPEGLLQPLEFVDELDGLSEVDVRRIMRDNFATLVGQTA
jgi:predicted TIM-barrel fold metal-dependent hydrolase